MRGFKDQPIARKALVLGLVPTSSAIVLVVAASIVATYLQARNTQVQDLETESAIVADNVSAALAFNDKQAASDTIAAFRAKNNIDAVCVFDATGQLFASFVHQSGACPPRWNRWSAATTLVHEREVTVGARQVGTVRLTGNFSRLYAWMRRQLLVALITLVAGVFLSLILTRRLGRAITVPVVDLASTADRVSTSGDYTMRATKTTNDELGRLAQSFNGMLDQIQRQHEATATLLEREQETSRLKDHFLAAVSHELRTPLNAILGWVQILRSTKPNEQTIERAMESLARNARAQARVIEDLIEISRVVTGKLRLKTDVVDLRDIVNAAVDVMNPGARAKSLHISTTLPETASLVVGDPDRLQQIVWNLLSNAVKFTPAGGSIAIDLSTSAPDHVLAVRDTGVGMSPAFLPYAFDRFRQADGSMSREYGGLGLGLAIVKELAELHGGTVAVTSAGKGKGATFTVRLPQLVAADRSSQPIKNPEASGLLPRDALVGVRILVVDDEADALEVVAAGLSSVGAEVRAAASGPDAIQAWATSPFDVLVCDLAMPQVDGFAVLKHIREYNGTFNTKAFAIALTAHASDADRQRSLAAGFWRHLSKPYDLRELIDTILVGLHDQRPEGA